KRAGAPRMLRVFGRLLGVFGIRADTFDDAVRAMDDHGQMQMAVDVDGVKQFVTALGKFIERMRGNGFFHDPRYRLHEAPYGWLLHNWEMRLDHAAWLWKTADRLQSEPRYTVRSAVNDAERHTKKMRRKYAGFRWEQVIRPGEQPWNPIEIAKILAAQLPRSD